MPENRQYSIQLYTVRNALEADLTGTIRRLAEIGFTRAEPYGFHLNTEELNAAFTAHGITAPSGHAPLLSADQHAIFAAARKLGITTVIEPYIPPEHWATEEDIRATAKKLNDAAQLGAEYGIRVGYHNHAWEIENRFDGRIGLEVLVEHLNPEVVIELDTYWTAVGGEDPVGLLARLGDRVRFIHIKDGPISTDTSAQLPAGEGRMPVREIIAAAAFLEVGVVEFDAYDADIFDGVARSLAFLIAAGVNA